MYLSSRRVPPEHYHQATIAVEVRDVVEADYDDWLRLFGLYLKFYKSELSAEIKEGTFKRFLDKDTDMWCAVAVDTDTKETIGFANYLTHLNTRSPHDSLYLNDLYVAEDKRLKGVGRSLIEYVYKKGDDLGVDEVYWCTQLDNYRAQLLYSKVGKNKGMVIYHRPPKP